MRRLESRLPSATATVAAAVFVGALAVCLTWTGFQELQADSYRLLYTGRVIAHHGLPTREVFTLAAHGRAFADQQWLAELMSYGVWRAVGYGGLTMMFAAVLGFAYGLLTVLLRRRGASLPVAIAGATLAVVGALSLSFVRAQILVLPAYVAVLWWCLADAQRDRLEWKALLILPLLALWANLHGSVLIGVATAAVHLALRTLACYRSGRSRQAAGYAVLGVLVLATPLATPYGLHGLAYYREMIGNPAVARADIEWDPPAFPALSFFQFVLPVILAAGCAIAAGRRGRWPRPTLIAAFVVSAIPAALAMRNNIWLGMAAAALIADASPALLKTATVSPRFVRGLAVAGVGLLVVGFGRFTARSDALYQAHAPQQAVASAAGYIDAHPCAHVLADSTSASALLWLDPAAMGRVGFDGELEAYPQNQLFRWIGFQSAAPGWRTTVGGYQLLLATRDDHPALAGALASLPGARTLSRDHSGVAVLAEPAASIASCQVSHA